MLAVRGERLHLAHYEWSDEAGNQSAGLGVAEIDDEGRFVYDGRYDEDDFEGAYRELERRYYAGEGAAFAENGHCAVRFVEAMDQLDVEAARRLAQPDFRFISPPSTLAAQERSLDDFFGWLQERARQVSSVKNTVSAIRWLSPECAVVRTDVRAVGSDGEEYVWTRIHTGEFRDGLIACTRRFEIDEEAAAFAYAEERVRASASRLAVSNHASEAAEGLIRAIEFRDVGAAVERCSDHYALDDRRRFAGDPIQGKAAARTAIERIHQQFSHFESRTLAVRGEKLALCWSRWFDDAGNESAHLHVFEIDDDGRIAHECRFDDEDLEGAYWELEMRYRAGEGAAFSESVMHSGGVCDSDESR